MTMTKAALDGMMKKSLAGMTEEELHEWADTVTEMAQDGRLTKKEKHENLMAIHREWATR